jgi:hypothetical protein
MNIDDFFRASSDLFTKPTQKTTALYQEKLVLKAGNEYVVRLLPYLKEGREAAIKKSIYPYYTYTWRSVVDGRWQYVSSPRTWGERCPISDWFFAVRKTKDPLGLEKLKDLSFKEGAYYNVYVVDDPTNPENNGKVKILQASKQINSVITEAASDDPKVRERYQEELDVDNMRQAMFDLSPSGINFCISAQEQGGFINYKSSRFIRRKRNLGLSQEEIDNIYQQVFDLSKIDRVRTSEEVEKLFCETFLGMTEKTTQTEEAPKPRVVTSAVQEEKPVVRERNVEQERYYEPDRRHETKPSTSDPDDILGGIDIDDIENYLAQQEIQ